VEPKTKTLWQCPWCKANATDRNSRVKYFQGLRGFEAHASFTHIEKLDRSTRIKEYMEESGPKFSKEQLKAYKEGSDVRDSKCYIIQQVTAFHNR
jgi:hypothetical protein